MLNIDFLRRTLDAEAGGLSTITEPRKQVIESPGGYDGIVSLVQTKGISPMVVLEQSSTGELSFRPGGFVKTSQSIWVMKMVGRDDDRGNVQRQCFAAMKRILAIFGKHQKDEELKEWEWDHIPYGVRNAGPNFTGYEFTLYFSEDTDLEYHPLTQEAAQNG